MNNSNYKERLIDQGVLYSPGQIFSAEELEEQDSFTFSFFQKRKKGKVRVVDAPDLGGQIADTHAHLEMLSSPAANLARCAFYGVNFICSITDPVEDAKTTLASVKRWQEDARALLDSWDLSEYVNNVPDIRVAMGCHPHNAKDYTQEVEENILAALKNPLVSAIGEVGLDYHYDLSPRSIQKDIFKRQIQLAHVTGLPLILHMREAHEDGLEILRTEGLPSAGVLLHCFNLDKDTLAPWVDLGCYIAFGGPLTFKNADEVRESALNVPLTRLLTETDSPYMTPEPMRGMECGPEHTVFTMALLLDVLKESDSLNKDITLSGKEEEGSSALSSKNSSDAIMAQLYENAQALLNREPTAWQKS